MRQQTCRSDKNPKIRVTGSLLNTADADQAADVREFEPQTRGTTRESFSFAAVPDVWGAKLVGQTGTNAADCVRKQFADAPEKMRFAEKTRAILCRRRRWGFRKRGVRMTAAESCLFVKVHRRRLDQVRSALSDVRNGRNENLISSRLDSSNRLGLFTA